MSGFPGNLSDSQKEKLRKFKENVADVLKPEHDDVLLLKFLRARKFDLKRTEKMLRMDIKWREENKVSTILDWYKIPEVFEKYWCGGVCGLDKEGHAIYISPVGNFDPKGVLFSAKASDILKTYIHSIEYQFRSHKRFSEQRGLKHTEGSLMIFDMENLGVHHLWKPAIDMFIKASIQMYEFQTDCSDIKFGFDLVDAKGKKTAILKLEKYNSHMVPENGEIMIAEPGTYVARFDNSHSWTKSKKLSYWLELLEPSDVEPEFQEMVEGADSMNLND
eukprot:XP_011675822.1 PREDICTED: SEC14-like protein 2 [Strongylocentrotus purpuratus]